MMLPPTNVGKVLLLTVWCYHEVGAQKTSQDEKRPGV